MKSSIKKTHCKRKLFIFVGRKYQMQKVMKCATAKTQCEIGLILEVHPQQLSHLYFFAKNERRTIGKYPAELLVQVNNTLPI
jgi:hypothetical protein